MIKTLKQTRFWIVAATVATVLCAVAAFCIIRSTAAVSTACALPTEALQSWTTTDKLYIQLPNKEMSFTTIGGQVNGGVHSDDVSSKSDKFSNMHDWLELYIQRDDGKRWNVPSADAAGDKWYFNSGKHALKGSVSLYLNIKSEMPSGTLYTFLCNGDRLWQRRKNPYLSHPCEDSCNLPVVKVTAGDGRTLYNSNPFSDSRELQVQQSISIGAANGWKITSHNMTENVLGINPSLGAVKLANIPASSGTCTISFDLWAGAYVVWNNLEAGPGQNANRAVAQHDTFSVSFSTAADSAAPSITANRTASNTSVSATWTDRGYSFATYTRNGSYVGEYSSGAKLSAEGRYVITATDCVGNSSSKTLFVDKTAPKFGSEFYDAAGKSVIKYTKASSYTLPFPTALTNESAINTRATYVRSYYDAAAGRVIEEPVAYYNKGSALTAEGRYDITVSDAAGNTATCTVIIDRTPPELKGAECGKDSVYASYSYSGAESPITSTYTLTTSSGTDAARSYGSGMRLATEGKYVISATDEAGNTASKTLYVDRSAPSLTRSFEYGASDGSVTFSRTSWESPVSAVYDYTGDTGTESDVAYSSGQALAADGKYTVTATDGAGNKSSISLIVDRKAPTLTFGDSTTGAMQVTRASSSIEWDVKNYEAPVTVTYSFSSENKAVAPDIDDAAYISGDGVNAEGTYSFTATDSAGNTARASIIIDRTAPSLTFTAGGIEFDRYINSAFIASGDDALSGVEKIELYENGAYKQYDFAPRSANGEYLFRVTDKAGNVTSANAMVFATSTFGNLAAIRDGYKLNAWYTVTLPARIFTTESKDAAGRYSFASYENALEFAMSKEREFRVTAVQGGYMYVSAANEAVAQKYDDEASLVAVIEKYAKGYISMRQTASANGNDKFFTEPDSLTRNSPLLPDYLLELKDLPRYYAKPSTAWKLPSLNYISAMPYTVTAKYLGDFTEDKTQKEVAIPSGASLRSLDGYRQGWYLITESDVAGNSEKYLIYSDAELPTVRAVATRGDGSEDILIDYAYTQNETLYYLTLELSALLDNTDPYVTLKIEKGSTVKYFTQSDALPTLGSDDYTSGKYTLTVYDRSLNALIFDVYIAGAAPTMAHGSLAADKPECKISFATSDRFNVITSITLYKIEYDGTKTVLYTDGAGTTISAATLSYVLTVGGKYSATLTDNYRRTVEIPPIFFLKGLPSGKLEGVKDGGRTNRNVAFTFDGVDVCEIYILLPGGERQAFSNYTVQTGAELTTYNITADEDTSHEYLVFLHNAQDMSLFVEYTFEIDTILPEFEITDSEGNAIAPDGATNKSFSIKWQETGVYVRYYTARSGSLGATKYNMNAVLTQGTLYYFTLTDDVGNKLDFTVLLDNAVDYTIGGKYNAEDGVLYANSQITFTVNEPTQGFDVKNADGFTVENGGTLTKAGRYEITVTDNYRNTVKLVIVLDFTPPSIKLEGAVPGESVKNDVAVTASDYDYLYLADKQGNKIKDVSNGEVFSAAGYYSVTARDHAGNAVTVTFSIDLSVDYTLSVPNSAITTGSVMLDSAEALTVEVKLDGETTKSAMRFTAPGEYELTLSDGIGNTVSCVFIILPARMRTVERQLPMGAHIVSVTRDGAAVEFTSSDRLELDTTGAYSVVLDCGGETFEFELEVDNTPPVVTVEKDGNAVKLAGCDKENVTISLTKDGSAIDCRVGQTFEEPGHYVLTVTDDLGNVATYEFDIKYRLNAWAIIAIIVGAVALIVAAVLIIRARRKPRIK